MEDVYTQHASYYPQGRRLYNNYVRVLDYPCEVLLNDIINPFDNCHLWVRIGTEYHTYDPLTVGSNSIGNPYSLNEYEAGRYTLEFDVSGISPGTYTLALNVTDNLDPRH